jgi:hypothetical protein
LLWLSRENFSTPRRPLGILEFIAPAPQMSPLGGAASQAAQKAQQNNCARKANQHEYFHRKSCPRRLESKVVAIDGKTRKSSVSGVCDWIRRIATAKWNWQ